MGIINQQSILQFGKCLLNQQDIIKTLVPYENLPIMHTPLCHLDENPISSNRRVVYASVGIISDLSSSLLITRRHRNLKTFPSNWVFPGGRLDKEENFESALLREINEETGIDIAKDDKDNQFKYKGVECSIKPLFLYESLFPDHPAPLRSQVLIVFYHIVIPMSNKDIEVKVQLKEVEGYSWIDIKSLYEILFEAKKIEFEGVIYNHQTHQFDKESLNERHLVYTEGAKEYIAHGHKTAIEMLYKDIYNSHN